MKIHNLLPLVAFTAAACSSRADPGPFTINYALDTEAGGCESANCGDYGLSCGAVLSIRITDPETGAVIVTTSPEGSREAQLCEAVSPSAELCGLANLPPGSIFFDLPPKMLRIEVAAWNADALDDGECPDEDLFDLAGRPLPAFNPQPAFAGATYFDASSDATEALVMLSCSDPMQVDTLDCAPEELRLNANVIDIETPPSETAQAPLPDTLLVRVAGVRQVLINEEIFTEIDALAVSTVLEPQAEIGEFSALIPEGDLPNPACVLVFNNAPQETTTVICDNYEPQSEVDLRGALMPKPPLDEILAAVELAVFPPEGLLIGRVFDESGTPLAGATVTPVDAPSATVEYLNSSRDDTLGNQTFDNGYFIARDVPFGTTWMVSGAVGMVPVRTPIGGLVRNQLTLLPVVMRDDIAP